MGKKREGKKTTKRYESTRASGIKSKLRGHHIRVHKLYERTVKL